MSAKYKVSVYATKAGYENSDMTTVEIDVRGLKGDVNGDGEVSVTDIVATVNIIMKGGTQCVREALSVLRRSGFIF